MFAAIIAVVGCFQGFCTKGGADSVGRQTTRSVVQSSLLRRGGAQRAAGEMNHDGVVPSTLLVAKPATAAPNVGA